MAAEARAERALRSGSPAATEALGEALGALLPDGAVLALSGDLGAGKTCLVRGLARGMGVEERVSSPTFTLMHTYEGRRPLHHFDAWMEGRERAFLADGGVEWLGDEGVAVVEWAERVADWLPRPHLRLELRHVGPTERELRLSVVGEGPGAEPLARALAALPLAPELTELPL
jgi:tRNA threonylcarbamoyladenosine biosynthesis protein TsaE